MYEKGDSMPQALVVDDARVIRLLLSSSLSDLGYDAIQAANGKEGLAALDEAPSTTLALVDWNMPVMNGLEFVKAARADPRFSSLTIVMVTTETEFERITTALDAGANDYIMKPFTPEIVAEKLLLLGLLEGQSV
jgi:two-component system chemotaxis response regulator CheY